jgi:adenylosuccinate lyase
MNGQPSAMRRLFSPASHQLQLMKIEVALARVQGRAGIIPVDAARRIEDTANLEAVPVAAVAGARARVGHPMVALLEAWNEALTDRSGEWLHFGATTQDIEDTAAIIELQAAGVLLLERLKRIEDRLLETALAHAATPMIGRTVGRHALPITFGLKVSRWAAENRRGMQRLASWLGRNRTGMLSGAVGSYASMGENARILEAAFMAELGLAEPQMADWKGSKDMFAEFGADLAILATTWRKIAQEVFLLQGDDFEELEEKSDAVGSSTMPHKHNPRHCRRVVSLARLVPRQSEVLLDWMVSIFERDQISSVETLAEICITFDDLLAAAESMLLALEVKPDNMRQNLHRSGDLVMAEHAMFLLAPLLGKHSSHTIVRRAVAQAVERRTTLAHAICDMPDAKEAASRLDLSSELDPERYIGLSDAVTRQTIAELRRVPV